MMRLGAMDWLSWSLGIVSALVVLAVGKIVDHLRTEHRQEVDSAQILGELRAGLSSVLAHLAALETRMTLLESRIDAEIHEHNRIFHTRSGTHGGIE